MGLIRHPGNLSFRAAEVRDANAIGVVHVRAWQQAYRNVMPDEYLDGLSADDRSTMWKERLALTELPPMLVADLDGEVVGFAVFGAEQPGPDERGAGQLYAINLDPLQWRKGIGRALLREATATLAGLGFREAILWVVPENVRARALYESEGWATDGGHARDDVLGVTVDEIRYRRPLSD